MSQSIVESLAEHAAGQPGKLCLVDARHSLTYRQAWDAVQAFAENLTAYVQQGEYALIECNQRIEFVVAMLGTQLAGAIAVPLEKNAAAGRIAEIAIETGARVLMGKALDETTAGAASADDSPIPPALLKLPLPNIDGTCQGRVADSSSESARLVLPHADDIAEILFSTGTTGKSKGIVITHGNNVALAENVTYGVQMKSDNVEIIPMPLSHSHGLRRTYSNIFNGSTAVICEGALALKRMFNLMDEYRATAMDISPSILSIIFKLSKDRLGEYADVLDYVQLGSAPLGQEDKERIKRLLPNTRLYNFYGSTESGCSCLLEFSKVDKPNCVGLPCVNADFAIVDDERNVIDSSPDRLGFITSAGSMNMREYLNAPELTAEALVDGRLYTKDLGYIDDEGFIYMVGRKDDVINFGGVKIAPEEIEGIVAKHPHVEDCACVPIPDELTGQKPLLCIALDDPDLYDAKEFKTFLAQNLDANKQPQRIEIVTQIPRTFNGKIQRRELVARFARQ